MSPKVENFVRAYLVLSTAEKKEVINIVKALEGAGPMNESVIAKSFGIESRSNTVNFAPAPGSCPTCGR